MEAQMGEMPDVLDGKVLDTIHAPYVVTPTERGRMRKFLERLGTAWYGYGWRSYEYAGHRIIGHRGGIRGYRSFILFDPDKKSGVVALWNSDTWQPGGLEFEVMDQIYHLPFRDWLELNSRPGVDTQQIASADPEIESGSGDLADACSGRLPPLTAFGFPLRLFDLFPLLQVRHVAHPKAGDRRRNPGNECRQMPRRVLRVRPRDSAEQHGATIDKR